MQPIKQLSRVLGCLAGRGQALFSLADLRAALPEHASGAFRAVVMRADQITGTVYLLPMTCREGSHVMSHWCAPADISISLSKSATRNPTTPNA